MNLSRSKDYSIRLEPRGPRQPNPWDDDQVSSLETEMDRVRCRGFHDWLDYLNAVYPSESSMMVPLIELEVPSARKTAVDPAPTRWIYSPRTCFEYALA